MTRPTALGAKIALVAVAVLLSACTDLGAVRDWAATSLRATQYNEVVATYADTPRRLAFYDRDAAAAWQEQAIVRQAQADALTQQLALVADYMAALAALAADVRFARDGRQVKIAAVPDGADLNDVLLGRS